MRLNRISLDNKKAPDAEAPEADKRKTPWTMPTGFV